MQPERPHLTHTITAASASERLDMYLAHEIGIATRSHAQRLIREGRVTVNGAGCKPGQSVHAGDRIQVNLKEGPGPPLAEPLPLTVLFEDGDMVVVDKPAGMVVHPAPGHSEHTLVNALLNRYPDLCCGEVNRPGIVHRLDKDTSGVMVVARHTDAKEWLALQFKEGTVHKTYLVLVVGHMAEGGTLDAPISRHPIHRKRMAIVPGGKHAVTHYTPVEHFDGFTLVKAHPVTGRTHQIRVHMAAIDHPVAGDRTYGQRAKWRTLEPVLQRHFLHAAGLTVRPPNAPEHALFTSPLPPDLNEVLRHLRMRALSDEPCRSQSNMV